MQCIEDNEQLRYMNHRAILSILSQASAIELRHCPVTSH
jgi:hypothetical protein